MAASDPTGKKDLGVDLSQAGTTKADNAEFMKTLTVDQQGHVKKACLVAVKKPAEHAVEVVSFCKSVSM
jgi:hypothetical protein